MTLFKVLLTTVTEEVMYVEAPSMEKVFETLCYNDPIEVDDSQTVTTISSVSVSPTDDVVMSIVGTNGPVLVNVDYYNIHRENEQDNFEYQLDHELELINKFTTSPFKSKSMDPRQ